MTPLDIKASGTLIAVLLSTGCLAAGTTEPAAEGTVFRSVFGDTLENEYGITVSGLLNAGVSLNNNSSSKDRKSGLTNSPLTGLSDEGFELAGLHLFVDKSIKTTEVLRVTPLPGPAPTEASFGFTMETLYGRNAQNSRLYGWDAHWGINSPGDKDSAKATRDRQNFLSTPNLAATAYLPFAGGVTVMAGIFGSGIGYEIPSNLRFARNPFATHSYALIAEAGPLAGVLVGTRVVNDKDMLLGLELGVVQGQANVRDNNDEKSVMGAVRWRTADMNTWIDYEFLLGDSQNDSFSDVQTPKGRITSPDGQFKQMHSLNGWHKFDQNWSMGAEVLYGHQDGDGKPSTVDVITGPGFNGARWWGANAVLTYRIRKDLSFSTRLEHFDDRDGFIQFPASTARGTYRAITTGLRYDVNKYLVLRPELRYDTFDAREHDRPFGNGDARNQLTGAIEALVYF
ncbi:outer membrane beta-barrel protein [Pseudomonas sp. X10]